MFTLKVEKGEKGGHYFINKGKTIYISKECSSHLPDTKKKITLKITPDGSKYYNEGGKQIYLGGSKDKSKKLCNDVMKKHFPSHRIAKQIDILLKSGVFDRWTSKAKSLAKDKQGHGQKSSKFYKKKSKILKSAKRLIDAKKSLDEDLDDVKGQDRDTKVKQQRDKTNRMFDTIASKTQQNIRQRSLLKDWKKTDAGGKQDTEEGRKLEERLQKQLEEGIHRVELARQFGIPSAYNVLGGSYAPFNVGDVGGYNIQGEPVDQPRQPRQRQPRQPRQSTTIADLPIPPRQSRQLPPQIDPRQEGVYTPRSFQQRTEELRRERQPRSLWQRLTRRQPTPPPSMFVDRPSQPPQSAHSVSMDIIDEDTDIHEQAGESLEEAEDFHQAQE